MDEDGDHFIATALPLDDVDSSDVDLVGRLVELVRRVEGYLADTTQAQTLSDWVGLGRRVIDGLTATTLTDAWQVNHAYAELARLAEAVETPAGTTADTESGPSRRPSPGPAGWTAERPGR